MNCSIRQAERRDIPSIVAFNTALAHETENIQLDNARLQKGVEALFDHPSYGYYLVAEVDGSVIGQMMVTYEWSDWRNGMFWWIQSVFVKKEFRKAGVFRTLYAHVIQQAKNSGSVCGLRLYVDKHNERAYHVYEKLGMTLTDYNMMEVDFVLQR